MLVLPLSFQASSIALFKLKSSSNLSVSRYITKLFKKAIPFLFFSFPPLFCQLRNLNELPGKSESHLNSEHLWRSMTRMRGGGVNQFLPTAKLVVLLNIFHLDRYIRCMR